MGRMNLALQEWAVKINQFINKPPPLQLHHDDDIVKKTLYLIEVVDHAKEEWSSSYYALCIFSGVKQIITYACKIEEDLGCDLVYLYVVINMLFATVSPKAILRARDTVTTIEQNLRSIISAIPNRKIYEQEDFFNVISGNEFTWQRKASHICLHTIIRYARHYLCSELGIKYFKCT